MKKKAAVLTIAGFFTYGSLVTIHAVTPHQCVRHQNSPHCTHTKDSGDLHAPGEPSENMKKADKNKDWMDLVGCGCFWDCLFAGATNVAPSKVPGILLKHGLFAKG
jgi:hypothetical protein